MNNIKSSFLPDLWIKCLHDGEICLGRTYLQESSKYNIKSNERVSLVTEKGQTKDVHFSEITNAAILKIFTAFDFERENVVRRSNGKNTEPFGLIKTLAQHQLKSKMS